jgi:hypothetical protein
MARRLQNVVAGREAIGARGEAATHRRSANGPVRVNHLEGDPNRLAVNQVAPFHPQHWRISVETAVGDAWQEIDFCGFHLFVQLSVARETDRQWDVLGMPRLDRFHQTRGPGRRQVDTLAVKYGGRSRVRPAHHDDRNSGSIEARKICDASNAKTRSQRRYSCKRLLSGQKSGTVTQRFRSRAYLAKYSHGFPDRYPLEGGAYPAGE